MNIPELDGKRIIDAKFEKGYAIVITASENDYTRWTFVFDKAMKYTVRKQDGLPAQDVNFTVMDKGVCVAANEDTVEIFADNSQVKVIPDSPLTGTQRLISFGNKIYVINRDSLYQLSLK